MPFPSKKIKIQLKPCEPTVLDTNNLKVQLQRIGLSCAEINQQNLDQYLTNVKSQLPSGKIQTFGIQTPSKQPFHVTRMMPGVTRLLAEAVPTLEQSAKGNWEPSSNAQGFAPNLSVIQYPDHFNWLYANRATNGFTGVIDTPPEYSGYYSNAQAIQDLFTKVGVTSGSTLVKGLDKDSLLAAMSNAIGTVTDQNLSNYDVKDSRVLYLVEDYNPSTNDANAIGVLYIRWHLTINDYKRKSKDGGDTHNTKLKIESGSVLYGDAKPLCDNYFAVLKQFNINTQDAPSCIY